MNSNLRTKRRSVDVCWSTLWRKAFLLILLNKVPSLMNIEIWEKIARLLVVKSMIYNSFLRKTLRWVWPDIFQRSYNRCFEELHKDIPCSKCIILFRDFIHEDTIRICIDKKCINEWYKIAVFLVILMFFLDVTEFW